VGVDVESFEVGVRACRSEGALYNIKFQALILVPGVPPEADQV
jgi:hypothetical protein